MIRHKATGKTMVWRPTIEALAAVAAHDQSPLSIRVAAIDELRRLALEER